MTEAQLYQRIKPWLNALGMPNRIENSISSGMPDVLFMRMGAFTFIELKIVHSGKIKMPKFQFAYGKRLMSHILPAQHLVVMWDKAIFVTTFPQVSRAPHTAAGNVVTVDVSGVNMELIDSQYQLGVIL